MCPIDNVFQASPAIVRMHFDYRCEQMNQRIEQHLIQVSFCSEVAHFGPGSICAIVKNDTYFIFTEEARQLGGSCFFVCHIFNIRSFADVDVMFMRIGSICAVLQPLFPKSESGHDH